MSENEEPERYFDWESGDIIFGVFMLLLIGSMICVIILGWPR